MGILDRFSLQGRTALVTGGAAPMFGSSISDASEYVTGRALMVDGGWTSL